MLKPTTGKPMKRNIHLSATALMACLTIQGAQADQYHYTNLLIGDRASGLGGAYTAIADDPSGLFYNPAGIIYGSDSNVSGSMNAYQMSSTTYENVLGGAHDWTRNSSALVPNFFGVFQPFGKGKLGFSYAVTDSVLEDQDQTFRNVNANVTQFTINTNNQDTTYNIGPSFAMAIRDDLAVGFTLYGHIRTREHISNQLVFGTYGAGIPDESWSNEYDELDEFGFRPIFGLMWTPRDDISIGLNINRTLLSSSSRDIQNSYKCPENPDTQAQIDAGCPATGFVDDVFSQEASSSSKATYPLQMRLGAAYFPSPSLLLSGDLIYNGSTNDGKEAVVNFAVGSEYYLDASWAVRAGLFSDFANTPDVKSGRAGQAEHIDMIGVSLSGSHFSRNSALSVGFSYATGKGKADVFGDGNIQDARMSSLTIFMSATYSY